MVATCSFLAVLGLVLAGLTAFPSAALSHECVYEFGSTAQRVGNCETVFDWTNDSCHSGQHPDAPARAFRDAHVSDLGLPEERVQLTLPHNKNTRMIGLTLNDVDPEQQRPELDGKPCGPPTEPLNTILWNPTPSTNPGQFHQVEWVNSVYTEDGRTIYALIHNEYHGGLGGTNEDGVNCAPGPRCEYYTITASVSTPLTDPVDYGRCYGALEPAEMTPLALTCKGDAPPLVPPAHFVAGLPHKYEGNWDGVRGAQAGTNVIKNDDDGYYYAMFAMRGFAPDPQNPPDRHPTATCLMRTDNLADPKSWRTFGGYQVDGSERWVSFVDPYDPAYDPQTDPPADHFCTNVPNALASGLTYNTYFKKYMSIGTKGQADAEGPAGVYYSLSEDLRHWGQMKLIMKTETNATFNAAYEARGGPQNHVDLCDLDDPVSHPVILDPSDPAASADPGLNPNGWRNFDHPGRTPYLYFRLANTHSNNEPGELDPCNYGTNDRDLVRLKIKFNQDPDGYARPRSATPLTLHLVPAYSQCTAGNGVHGVPLDAVSCGPPTQVSNHLTVGTPDANGRPADSTGSVELKVLGESPINNSNGDQADVRATIALTDVLKQSDLSDYVGELEMVATMRMTDRGSGSGLFDPATVIDLPLRFTVPCSATTGEEGGSCQLTTTADGVMPGIAQEGNRAVWELVDIGIYDGGADGLVSSPDNTLFAVEGLFAP